MKVLEERMSSLTSPQRSLYISDFTWLIDGKASVVETMAPKNKIQNCGCPQGSQNLSSTKRDPSFFEHAEDSDQRRQAKIRGRKPSESPTSTFKPLIPPVASSSNNPPKHQSWAIPSQSQNTQSSLSYSVSICFFEKYLKCYWLIFF